MAIEITFNDKGLADKMRKAPKAFYFAVDRQLERGAMEIARAMKRKVVDNDSMGFSTMLNSIKHDHVGQLEYAIGPHVAYARYVEEGRDPGGKMPPLSAIIDWVKVKRGVVPSDPNTSARDMAFMIGKKIQREGIEARPFVSPFARDKQVQRRVTDLVQQGVQEVLNRVV